MKDWQTWIKRWLYAGFIWVVLPAHADTTIDTTTTWDGSGVVGFGGVGAVAYGQTITAPSDSVLQSFSFFVQDHGNTVPVQFNAYVASWNGSANVFSPNSPVLFTSPVITSAGEDTGWEEITVNANDLLLTPGNQYVLFLGTYGLYQGPQYELVMGYVQQDSVYAGGQFVLDPQSAAEGSLDQISANPWHALPGPHPGLDAAFVVDFQSTPEPGTVTLLLTLSAAMGLVLKRRGNGKLESA
jgi:hypothetical protein